MRGVNNLQRHTIYLRFSEVITSLAFNLNLDKPETER